MKASEWLPIESAPKDGDRVILIDGLGCVEVCRFKKGEWAVSWNDDLFNEHDTDAGRPTHWMPLQEAPK